MVYFYFFLLFEMEDDEDLGIWKYLLTVQRSQQYWVQPIKAERRAQKFTHTSRCTWKGCSKSHLRYVTRMAASGLVPQLFQM